jgi:hypothetical protein
VLVTLLAGCVSIPERGPIQQGRTLVDAQRPPRVQIYAAEPAPGAAPIGVVRGFLLAAADFSADHRVARAFLTPDRRTTWRPDAPVVVYRGETSLVQLKETEQSPGGPSSSSSPSSSSLSSSSAGSSSGTSAGTERQARAEVQVEVPEVARIDAQGSYAASEPGTVAHITFRLLAVDGQWRISNPEDGVLISEDDFQATFGDIALYYPERTGRWLVPDVRWFPVTSAPTAVVSALLAGPSPWLSVAVTNAAPDGTRLTANGVRSDGGRLVIDLNREALQADPAGRQVLLAQLESTLSDAGRVLEFDSGTVTVTVEQARFEVSVSAGAQPRPADQESVDPRPVVLDAQHRLARLTGLTATPVPGLPVIGPSATRPAVNADGTQFAVLVDGGAALMTLDPSSVPRVPVRAPGLTSPSFDPYGWVWTSPGQSGGTVYAVRGTERRAVTVPWLAGYQVRTLRVSREGARVLIVALRGRRSYVFVAAVAREPAGAPRSLPGPLVRLVSDLTAAVDGGWLDARRVVVLGVRPGDTDARIHVVEIGGKASPGLSAPDAVAITMGSSQYEMWVQTPRGAAYQSGSGFRQLPSLRWPSVPG